MKHIIFGLLKLFLIFGFLAILIEVVLANHAASAEHDWVHTSCSSISHSLAVVISLNWKGFWLVNVVIWLFQNKIHYLLAPLIILVVYYLIKEKQLERPAIGQNNSKVNDYEREKQEYTKLQVEQLKNSKEYQEYERKKKNGQLQEDGEDNDIDWQKAEQQIFED